VPHPPGTRGSAKKFLHSHQGAPSGKKIVARSDIWAKNLRPPISCEAPAASQSYTAENIHELMSENLRSPIIGEARGASHV